MQWHEVCEHYPEQWLIVEDLSVRVGADEQRYLDEVAVIEPCPDVRAAHRRSQQLHYRHPEREFYPVHTRHHAGWGMSDPLPPRRTPVPGEIEALYCQLRAEERRTQIEAGYALMRLDPPPLEWLLAALQDEDWRMRSIVAFLLSETGEVQATEPLIALLGDAHASVRWDAANTLGHLGDQRAVLPLIRCLRDPAANVRWCAAWALGTLRDKRAVEPLIQALADDDSGVQHHAAEALGNLGDARATLPLIEKLDDADVGVRQMVALVLGLLGDKRATAPLLDHLQDASNHVRQYVFQALGNLGGGEVLVRLRAAAQTEADSAVQATAIRVIERVEAHLERGEP
ncbi:MAG: HEAT repeat domain-containing protein [Ardenticatenales bacterium]|nr:HEAT repeat domain-containing protein [Ardenticatenales bacterium]